MTGRMRSSGSVIRQERLRVAFRPLPQQVASAPASASQPPLPTQELMPLQGGAALPPGATMARAAPVPQSAQHRHQAVPAAAAMKEEGVAEISAAPARKRLGTYGADAQEDKPAQARAPGEEK